MSEHSMSSDVPLEPMAETALMQFSEALIKAFDEGIKLTLHVTFRSAALAAIIPIPGEWEETTAEVYAVEERGTFEVPRRTIMLYDRMMNNPDDREIHLVEFPSKGVEYAKIKPLPFKSRLGAAVKRQREVSDDMTPSPIPPTQVMNTQVMNTTPSIHHPTTAQPPTTAAALVSAFDNIADSMRNEKKKITLVENLRIPSHIPEEERVWFPNIWIHRIVNMGEPASVVAREWMNAITQSQLCHGVHLLAATKRAQFESTKQNFVSLLASATRMPEDKTQWLSFFAAIKAVMMWFVFSNTGSHADADQFAFTFDKSYRDGSIDQGELLMKALAKNDHSFRQKPFNKGNKGKFQRKRN